jgi:FkbM family methyltransferase
MESPFNLKDVLDFEAIPKIEILDIGAMMEGEARYSTLMEQEIGSVTGFEPNQEEFRKLDAMQSGDYQWLPYCLGDGKTGELHVTFYPGCSSLYEPDSEIIDMFRTLNASSQNGNFRVVEKKIVQTIKLDDVDACPVSDYVKIDVQGSELNVSKNGIGKFSEAVVIEAEAEFLPLYKDQPLFGDLQVFLRDNGFSFHKFLNITGRCIEPFQFENNFSALSQAIWTDAIFVRDFPNFKTYSDFQLIKAAIILHDIYLSYDLSNLVLTKLDARQGTVFAKMYQKAIGAVDNLQRYYMNLNEDNWAAQKIN